MRIVHVCLGLALWGMGGCDAIPGPWNSGGDKKSPCDDANCGPGSVRCVEEDGAARCECWSGYTGPTCGECSTGYVLRNEVCLPVCGDGKVNGTEVCDDGNTQAHDGCSPTCALETGFECHGQPSMCTRTPSCGDAFLDSGEECDDGNRAAGDGCSSSCATEPGWGCTGEPSQCEAMQCGDGLVTGTEGCDDANFHELDGCTSSCTVEHGFTCTGEPSVCTLSCGDGVVALAEGCDDGNTTAGDGCSTICLVEVGFSCTGEPSTCTPRCGNGVMDTGEVCDDGNRIAGDGCSLTCAQEDHWVCTGVPSVCIRTPDPPVIQGESSAGHHDVTWTWSVPAGTARFHHRLDEGAATDVDASVTSYTMANLPDGTHFFDVQACNSVGQCSDWARFTTVEETLLPRAGYTGMWTGVRRALSITPLGNVAPVIYPSCYSDSANSAATNLTDTTTRLADGITKNADILELSIKDVDGEIYVDHDDDATTTVAKLVDVLHHAPLAEATQLLALDVVEATDGARLVTTLLTLLEAERENHVKNGRPLVLKAAHARRSVLLAAKDALATHPFLQHYVRLVEVLSQTDAADLTAFHALIKAAADDGLSAVQLRWPDNALIADAAYAHSLGLGVLVGTLPNTHGDVFLASLREEMDGLLTDYRLDKARTVVTDATSIAYLNASNQPAAATRITYYQTDSTPYQANINGANAPSSTIHPVGQPMFGTSLVFDAASRQALPLYDGDPQPNQGVLVTALVKFANLDLGMNETQGIVNKSQAGGFALELFRAPGETAVLQFGVLAGGSYHYATYPTASLNTVDTYFLIGAYDGVGNVWLFINNQTDGVTQPGNVTGATITTDVPITVGADPEPGNVSRMWFSGEIQQAMVQAWYPH